MATMLPILVARDVPRSVDFYVQAFGATDPLVIRDDSGMVTHGEVTLFGSRLAFTPDDRGPRAAHMPWRQRALASPNARGGGVALQISLDGEDLDALYERAKAANARVLLEPEDQVWGVRIFVVEDPDGYVTYVTTRPAARD